MKRDGHSRKPGLLSRRQFLAGSIIAGQSLVGMPIMASEQSRITKQFARLEQKNGGRLGVAILDTARGRPVSYRGNERFALCSTFKLIAAALVLTRVDGGQENLNRRIVYGQGDLVDYSPVTEKYIGGKGISMGDICEAALTHSDNTAANLMFDSFGGPAVLTAYLRSLGDNVTRLDRREPEMNEVSPGDLRDTTTPLAMLETLRKILTGTVLSASSRGQLIEWLVGNQTGDSRLRAGVPKGWRVGDKTGSGPDNQTNDIAIIWPPDRQPILVTAYYADSAGSDEECNAVLAEVARLAVTV